MKRAVIGLVLAALSLLVAAPGEGAARWHGFPVPGAGRVLADGEMTINLVPAHGYLYGDASEAATLEMAAARAGWRPAAVPGWTLATSEGPVRVRGWEQGAGALLLATGRGLVACLVCERALDWQTSGADLPGRDPGGWPRPGVWRRRLHLAGAGFESAVYDSPAPAAAARREAGASLARAGWTVRSVGEHGLEASRAAAPLLMVFVAPRAAESTVLVTTAVPR